MSNEFGFRGYQSMRSTNLGIIPKFIKLPRPRLLWLLGV